MSVKMVLYILTGIVNYIVISPILLTFLAVVFSVSSVGKAFGLRRLYVNFLLRIFEVSVTGQSLDKARLSYVCITLLLNAMGAIKLQKTTSQ